MFVNYLPEKLFHLLTMAMVLPPTMGAPNTPVITEELDEWIKDQDMSIQLAWYTIPGGWSHKDVQLYYVKQNPYTQRLVAPVALFQRHQDALLFRFRWL